MIAIKTNKTQMQNLIIHTAKNIEHNYAIN